MLKHFWQRFGLYVAPSVLGIIVVAGIFVYASYMTKTMWLERDQKVANDINEEIHRSFLQVSSALRGTSAFWQSSQEVTAEEFADYVKNAYTEVPGLVSVQYIDADNVVRYVISYEFAADAVKGFNLDDIPGRVEMIKEARESEIILLSQPTILRVGRPGVIIFQPLRDARGYHGQVAASISFDGLLANAQQDALAHGYESQLKFNEMSVPLSGKELYAADGHLITNTRGDERNDQTVPRLPDGYATVSSSFLGESWSLSLYKSIGGLQLLSYAYAGVNALIVVLLVLLLVVALRRRVTLHDALAREREFVSIVSHQLREPLTQLSWSCDVMMEDEAIPSAERCQMSKMHEIVRRAVRLTNDLLNVSRLERGVLAINTEDLPLSTLLEDVLSVMREAAARRGLEIRLTVPHGLSVMADRVKAAEAIRNILDNALKYAPEGSTVEIVAVAHQDKVQLAIADHGPGIPADLRDSFFERSSAAVKRGTGTGAGLGMYLTKMFLEKMGGRVSFKTSDAGTTFLVVLPAAPRQPDES